MTTEGMRCCLMPVAPMRIGPGFIAGSLRGKDFILREVFVRKQRHWVCEIEDRPHMGATASGALLNWFEVWA